MRDPDRIDRILDKIKEVWRDHSDWRLGQLLENLRLGHLSKKDPFYIEDDTLEEWLEDLPWVSDKDGKG